MKNRKYEQYRHTGKVKILLFFVRECRVLKYYIIFIIYTRMYDSVSDKTKKYDINMIVFLLFVDY